MFDADNQKDSLALNSTIKDTNPIKELLDEDFNESSESINNRGSDIEGTINQP